MSKEVRFKLYVSIRGAVEVDEYDGDPNELLDAIFPGGWEGEIEDAFINPQFMPEGYIEVTETDEEGEKE